jgi:uncharacterized spore protein YtfJ
MSAPVPFQPIAELFERSLSIRHVYGEPVRHGETTVIPVAKVAYGFGAGVGRTPSKRQEVQAGVAIEASSTSSQGVGGGGGARISPVGALEIGPHGTRFIHFEETPRLLRALAVGFATGLLLGRRHH